MKSKLKSIICLVLIAIMSTANLFAENESPFSIDSSTESIPLCKYIEDENILIRFPGKVVGNSYLLVSGLINFPLIVPNMIIGEIIGRLTGGFIEGPDFAFVFMACFCFYPAIAIGTAVSTPFYLIKKLLYDCPKSLVRKIKKKN